MISSSRLTACGFSILAITAARPRVIFFASAMSSGRWMKDSATQSMPVSSAASRSERSLSVSAENGIVVSGRLTPLRSESLPPTSTRVTMRFGIRLGDGEPDLAVVDQQRVARLDGGEDFRMRQVHARGVAGRCVGVEHEGVAGFHRHRAAGERADPQLRPLQIDQDADRPAGVALDRADHAHQLAHALLAGVAHVDAEDVGAGLEQLRDHVGSSTRPDRAWRRSWRGADVSWLGASGRRRRQRRRRARGVRSGARGGQRPVGRLLGGVGQLHRPGALLAGVDLEEAGAVIAARQAVLGAADGEFLLARAHEGLAGPFAAAVVVDRVDVIVTRDQCAAQQRFARARRNVPPAFGGPALVVLVADRDADPAAGVVAQPEIGFGRIGAETASSSAARTASAGDDMRNVTPDGDEWQCGHDVSAVPNDVRLSRDRSRPVNDDGTEVVHVGVSRPRHTADRPRAVKESGRIVVGKKGGGIEAAGLRARH